MASESPAAHEWGAAVYTAGVFRIFGGVTDAAAASDHHWIYDPSSDGWSTGPSIPTPAAGSAAAVIDSRIILAGGIDGPGAHSDNVHVFDYSSGQWSAGSAVPSERINWQGGAIDGRMYVAGGLSPGQITSSSLLSFDPVADSWASLPGMPSQNEGYASAVIGGLYCVLGGRIAPPSGSFSPPMDRFDCYSPGIQEWLSGPSIPGAVEELGAVAVGDDLYVIGGRVTFSGVTGAVYRIRRQ